MKKSFREIVESKDLRKAMFNVVVILLCFIGLIQPTKLLGFGISYIFKYLFGTFFFVPLIEIIIICLFKIAIPKFFKKSIRATITLFNVAFICFLWAIGTYKDYASYSSLFNHLTTLRYEELLIKDAIVPGALGCGLGLISNIIPKVVIYILIGLVLILSTFLFIKKALIKDEDEISDEEYFSVDKQVEKPVVKFSFNYVNNGLSGAQTPTNQIDSVNLEVNRRSQQEDFDPFAECVFEEETKSKNFNTFNDDINFEDSSNVKDVSDEDLVHYVPKQEVVENEIVEQFEPVKGFNEVAEKPKNEPSITDLTNSYNEETNSINLNIFNKQEIKLDETDFIDEYKNNDELKQDVEEIDLFNTLAHSVNMTGVIDKPSTLAEDIGNKIKEKIEEVEYVYPSITLLNEDEKIDATKLVENAKNKAIILDQKLKFLGVRGHVVNSIVAPSFTRFEIEVESDVKINQMASIKADIQMALGATQVTVLAPIPGTHYVGVDIPNDYRLTVSFRECFEHTLNNRYEDKLSVCIGKDIAGKYKHCSLKDAPHLLVAGSTNSGKSVCLNSIICSLLMKNSPNELKLLLIDPKKIEFSAYAEIPHLLCPIVIDPKKASIALKKVCEEMDRRYDLFRLAGPTIKSPEEYNEYAKMHGLETLPYIVVIIDEMSYLMATNKQEVEDSVRTITAVARACGIHLICATQRPSVDVITGVIKTNINSKISFAVANKYDSQIILDQTGAEDLLGKGDMLMSMSGELIISRVQCCFIANDEIVRIVEKAKEYGPASFNDEFMDLDLTSQILSSKFQSFNALPDEELYSIILNWMKNQDTISVNMIEKKFKLGNARAARMVEQMEIDGYLGEHLGGNKGIEIRHDLLP